MAKKTNKADTNNNKNKRAAHKQALARQETYEEKKKKEGSAKAEKNAAPPKPKPKPRVERVIDFKMIRMSVADWIKVPNNPLQKSTRASRPNATHLRAYDRQHQLVHMAVFPNGERRKLDGHGRGFVWEHLLSDAVPDHVQVICVPVKNDKEAGIEFWKYDGQKSAKRAEDYIFGSFKAHNIPTESTFFQRARGIKAALRYAFEVKNASMAQPTVSTRQATIDDHVEAFAGALAALDAIDARFTATKANPISFAGPVTMAFLLAFTKHGRGIVPFFEQLNDDNSGHTKGKMMDPFAAVKRFCSTTKIGAGEDHKAAAAVILGALDTYMKGRYTNPDYVPAMNMQKIMTVDLQQYLLKEKTKRTGRTLDR